MASKKRNENPDEIVHLQVKQGETVRYQDHAYGDRATLQVPRRNLDQVEGGYDQVPSDEVPDAGGRR